MTEAMHDRVADVYKQSRKAVGSLYVAHSNFESVLDEIIDLIWDHEPRGDDHQSLLVTGLPGAGKTTLVKKIAEAFPRVKDGCRFALRNGSDVICDHVPVLQIDCPTSPREKSVIEAMLDRLGDPFFDKRDLQSAMDVLERYLSAGATRAILVDEAQRPTDRQEDPSAKRRHLVPEVARYGMHHSARRSRSRRGDA
jgi:Cdc6-like AAA superfamily ATPase